MVPASTRMLHRLLAERFSRRQRFCGAELGVDKGHTSACLLRKFPRLQLLMVDWYAGTDCGRVKADANCDLLTAKEATEFARDRRIMLLGTTHAASRLVADGSLDFVFIDANHSYAGVAEDLVDWVPKVRVGGIISGHDYTTVLRKRYKKGVRLAVDEFIAASGFELHVRSRQIWQCSKTREFRLPDTFAKVS